MSITVDPPLRQTGVIVADGADEYELTYVGPPGPDDWPLSLYAALAARRSAELADGSPLHDGCQVRLSDGNLYRLTYRGSKRD